MRESTTRAAQMLGNSVNLDNREDRCKEDLSVDDVRYALSEMSNTVSNCRGKLVVGQSYVCAGPDALMPSIVTVSPLLRIWMPGAMWIVL